MRKERNRDTKLTREDDPEEYIEIKEVDVYTKAMEAAFKGENFQKDISHFHKVKIAA